MLESNFATPFAGNSTPFQPGTPWISFETWISFDSMTADSLVSRSFARKHVKLETISLEEPMELFGLGNAQVLVTEGTYMTIIIDMLK